MSKFKAAVLSADFFLNIKTKIETFSVNQFGDFDKFLATFCFRLSGSFICKTASFGLEPPGQALFWVRVITG